MSNYSYNPNGYYQPQQPQTVPNIALKKSFGSAVYLIAVIMETIALGLVIVSAFTAPLSVKAILDMLFMYAPELGLSSSEMVEISSLINQYMGVLSSTMIASKIGSCIVPIILLVGSWLIWANSKKPNLPVGSGGFTIMKVFAILDLIGICLVAVFVLILSIPAIIGGTALDQYMDLKGGATVLIILFLVIVITAVVLAIIYYAKLISIWTAGKDIAVTGKTRASVSMYVIVFNFIGLISGFFGIILSLVMLDFLGAGSSLCSLVQVLLLTITFIKFRNALPEQAAQKPEPPVFHPYPSQPTPSPYQAPQASAYQQNAYQPQRNAYNPQQNAYNPQAYGSNQNTAYNTGAYQRPAYQQPQGQSYQAQTYQAPQASAYQQNAYQPQTQAFQPQQPTFAETPSQAAPSPEVSVESAVETTYTGPSPEAGDILDPSDLIDQP